MRRRTLKKSAKKARKVKVTVWGRPQTYTADDADLFDRKCQAYFAGLKFNAPNIAGLCLFLGMSRETWYAYRKERKEFSDSIRNSEQMVESWWVNRLKYPGAGSIFYLKNFRPEYYKDRTPGDDPNEPLNVRITGMRITKEK